LIDASVKAEDFVNIVQHPGGLPKQIALDHNLVAYVDPGDTRVQYLTDTCQAPLGRRSSTVSGGWWRCTSGGSASRV
jgi:hypothetical protein